MFASGTEDIDWGHSTRNLRNYIFENRCMPSPLKALEEMKKLEMSAMGISSDEPTALVMNIVWDH
jgi:hypothetical protein